MTGRARLRDREYANDYGAGDMAAVNQQDKKPWPHLPLGDGRIDSLLGGSQRRLRRLPLCLGGPPRCLRRCRVLLRPLQLRLRRGACAIQLPANRKSARSGG